MKIIVDRIQGDHTERLELEPGDEIKFEDSWYGMRIVAVRAGGSDHVIRGTAGGPYCGTCGAPVDGDSCLNGCNPPQVQ